MEKRKVALVTGASRGIGRATATRLAQAGMDVAVHYNSTRKGAEETLRLVEEQGVRGMIVRADVSKWNEVKAVTETTLKAFGHVDVLVNNAGVYERHTFDDLTVEKWLEGLAVNLNSVYYCCKALVPQMKGLGWGRIVNLSSQIGFRGTRHGADYAAAKAGVVGFTKALALELAPFRITVNAVAPGAVDTDILAGDTPEIRERRNREIPLGRIGRPEEIAAAIAFLVSDEADWITGATLHVNGGSLLF